MLLSACTVALLSACSSNTRIANEVYAPAAKNELRAPATPLVTIDPYTSAWSFADRLNEESVRHWTGRNFPLLGSLRVDGVSYRFMGADKVEVTPAYGRRPTHSSCRRENGPPSITRQKAGKQARRHSGQTIIRIAPLPGKTATSGYAARSTGLRGRIRKICSCYIRTTTTSSCTSTVSRWP